MPISGLNFYDYLNNMNHVLVVISVASIVFGLLWFAYDLKTKLNQSENYSNRAYLLPCHKGGGQGTSNASTTSPESNAEILMRPDASGN